MTPQDLDRAQLWGVLIGFVLAVALFCAGYAAVELAL
jgi:hypothetical protein